MVFSDNWGSEEGNNFNQFSIELSTENIKFQTVTLMIKKISGFVELLFGRSKKIALTKIERKEKEINDFRIKNIHPNEIYRLKHRLEKSSLYLRKNLTLNIDSDQK